MTAARDGAAWFADSSKNAIRPLGGPAEGGLLFDGLTACALADDGEVWIGGSKHQQDLSVLPFGLVVVGAPFHHG